MLEQPAFRVLIVDDIRDAADSECTLLEMSGYQCRAVYEIHAALALAKDFQPQVVLLDLAMPKNGFRLADELRKAVASPVRLIAVTGRTDQQDRAAQAGFDHYLIKPVDPKELQVLLETIRQQGCG
jgi:DNA-binding response OmpR family regulator